VRVVRGHSRLCCLMRYFPERWFRRWGGVVQGGGEGLEPHIPFKGGGEVRDERRKKAKQVFSSALYRLRAVGVFGALKTRLACGFLQETSPLMAQKRALLGGVGLQPPGVPHPLFAFTLDPQGFLPSAPRLVRQAPEFLTPPAGAAFQVEWTKPQTPRAIPLPQTHTTTKSYGRPQT